MRKVPGIHKTSDVTLKRGIINGKDFWDWIVETRENGPSAKREVSITLLDEVGEPVQSWFLHGVFG